MRHTMIATDKKRGVLINNNHFSVIFMVERYRYFDVFL